VPEAPPSQHTGLVADLYHPDAAYVAWRSGHLGSASFDLYARLAPFGGAYMLAAGLEPALQYLSAFHFEDADLAFLARLREYAPGFLDYLRGLRFSGDVLAMPEGTVAFPNEPLLRVTAPYAEALLVESGLLQAVNAATLIATKAARITYAAQGRGVAEFALRRAFEPYTVARASFIGGCSSTSFLDAARRYGFAASGTIPHALVERFDTEEEAFRAVAAAFAHYTLLLDTYDAERGARTAVRVGQWSQATLGHTLVAVRLDGGDLVALAKLVRRRLDEGGLHETRVLASGDLDEFAIADLLVQGAPIDGFGVGTALGAASGSLEHGVAGGALGGVYKLVWFEQGGVGHPAVKVAGAKSTWPGRKQVYRTVTYQGDLIALEDEPPPAGSLPLLRPVMQRGHIVPDALPPLTGIAAHARASLAALPERYKALSGAPAYPVENSAALQELRRRAVEQENARNRGDGEP
jgi:nicotinate phosphoribosyltransferase